VIGARGDAVSSIRLTMSETATAGEVPAVAWTAKARGAGLSAQDQMFAPPSLGKDCLYLCSKRGDLVSIQQRDGTVQWIYATNQPIIFQPALAEGNLYAGTANGLLYCLKTGDPDADGWYAWGGNAQHNKK
jgi:outer membrane protein assembly factor BamB